MQKSTVPEELLRLREQIDALDEELLQVLARRFQITAQVGMLKATHGLNSLDEERETRKLETLQAAALTKELSPRFIGDLFQLIFAEVVNNHQKYKR
jgi:chorismate mutase